MLNKLIRKITWKNKGKLFMISALLAITISFFMSMSMGNQFLTKNINEVKNKYNAFDFLLKKEKDFNDKKLKTAESKYNFDSQIKEQKDVIDNVTLPNFKPVIVFDNDLVQVQYTAQVYNENDKISKPFIIKGTAPTAANEILVTKDLTDSFMKNVGDSIKIKNKEYKISGIFGNPENQTKNTNFLTEKSVKKLPILVSKKAFSKLKGKTSKIIYAKFKNANLSYSDRNNIYANIMKDKELQRKELFDINKSFSEKLTYDQNNLCIPKATLTNYEKSKVLKAEDFAKVKKIIEDSNRNVCSIGLTDTVGTKQVSSYETKKQIEKLTGKPAVNNKAVDFSVSPALNEKISTFLTNLPTYFLGSFDTSGHGGTTNIKPLETVEASTGKVAMVQLMDDGKDKGLDFMAENLLKYALYPLSKEANPMSTLVLSSDGLSYVSGTMYGQSAEEKNKVMNLDAAKKYLSAIIEKGKLPDNVSASLSAKTPNQEFENFYNFSKLQSDYLAIYNEYVSEKGANKTQNDKIAASNTKGTKDSVKVTEKQVKVTKDVPTVTKKAAVKKMVTKSFTYIKKVGTKATYYPLLSSLVDFQNLKSSKIVTEQKEKQTILNMVVFILLLSVLTAIVTTLITKIINNNKVEIGVLKAIGMKPEVISRSFIFIPVVVLVLGFLLSVPLTSVFSKVLITFYNNQFYIPLSESVSIDVISVVLALAIPVVILVGYTYFVVSYQVGINTLRLLANLGKKEKNKQINNPKLSMLMKQRINTLKQNNEKAVIIAIVSVIVTVFCAIFTFMFFSAFENYQGIGSEIKSGTISSYKQINKDTSGNFASINLSSFKVTDVYDNKFNHINYVGNSHKISTSNSVDLTVLGTNAIKSKYYDLSAYKQDDLSKGLILPDKFRSLYNIQKGYILKVQDEKGNEYKLDVSGFQSKDNNLFAFTDNTYISAKTNTFGYVNAHFKESNTFSGLNDSEQYTFVPSSAIEQSRSEMLSILIIIAVGIAVSIAIVIPLIAILVSNIYDDNKRIIATMRALGMSSKLIRQVVINPYLIIFSIASLITILVTSYFVAPLFTDIFFNFIGRDIVYHDSIIAIAIVFVFILVVYQIIVLGSTLQANRIKPAKILNDI